MIDLKTLVPDKVKDLFKDEKNRFYAIVGSTAAVGALYIFFAIVPQFIRLSAMSKEVKERNERINTVSTQVKQLDATTKKLQALKTELESYAKGLPKQAEVAEFLRELSAVAKSSDVKILSITPEELKPVIVMGKEAKYYREMPIAITAKSGYHQLGNFISQLENSERFINVENVSVHGDPKTPRLHNVTLILKTYVSIDEVKK